MCPIRPRCHQRGLDLSISGTLRFQHRVPTLGEFSSLLAGGVFVPNTSDVSKEIDLCLPGARKRFRVFCRCFPQLNKTLPRGLAEVFLTGAKSSSLDESRYLVGFGTSRIRIQHRLHPDTT